MMQTTAIQRQDSTRGRELHKALKLTEEQRATYAAAIEFIDGDDREMVIAGAAGTGKTVAVGHIVKALVKRGLKVAITAPTNKATGVRDKRRARR